MRTRPTAALALALLALAGCDDAPLAPDAGLPCKASLADHCASGGCPTTVAEARARFCASPQSQRYFTRTCGELREISLVGVDTGTTYYYDSGDQLLAVTFSVNGPPGMSTTCAGGPARFAVPTDCNASLSLCAGFDGGTSG